MFLYKKGPLTHCRELMGHVNKDKHLYFIVKSVPFATVLYEGGQINDGL